MELFQLSQKAWSNIYKHKFSYITNATLLQILMMTLGVGLLSVIFKGMLYFTGNSNLNKDSLVDIFTSPIGLVFVFLFMLAMAFLIFIEFSILTLNIYAYSENYYYSLKQIVWHSLKEVRFLIGPQMLFFILYFISMIPLANLGMSSILTEDIYIPKFITSELMKTTVGKLGYFSVILMSLYFNFRLFFVLPLALLNDNSIFTNIKRSWLLTRKWKMTLIMSITLFEIIIAVFLGVFLLVVAVVLFVIDVDGSNLFFQTLFFTIIKNTIFVFSVLTKVNIIAHLVVIIVKTEDCTTLDLKNNAKNKLEERKSKHLVFLMAGAIVASLVFNSISIYSAEFKKDIVVVGHRGYVNSGVENSLESLEGAVNAGVNAVEVDVLLTKDNKFVVMHDYNLKRLSGLNMKVEDMTYDEVVGLPIRTGVFKSTIPSLEEFVAKARELNVDLLIELKPHGKEPDNYPHLVVEKLKELGIAYDYRVMSLEHNVIEKIEAEDRNIKTGFVIPLQIGDFSATDSDFFVIEDSSYTHKLAEQAREKGKQLFVWTVNDREGIIKYLHSKVDGIITDRPDLVEEEKAISSEKDSYFKRAISILTE